MRAQACETGNKPEQSFRIDGPLHDLLMEGARPDGLAPGCKPGILPEPVFPRYPELAGDVEPDPRRLPRNGCRYRTHVTPFMIRRALPGRLAPFIRSRLLPGDFHPVIAYLFTEWKCNLDYCYKASRAIRWTLRQALRGFRGTTGSFQD